MSLHYFFVDESYRSGDQQTIVMAAWAVEQGRLKLHSRYVSDLYKPPVIERIVSLFGAVDARAVVASATLQKTLFRAGEIDGTDDVPAMARTDNVWSQSSIFTISTLLKLLLLHGIRVGTVDIYFDPKNLKPEHANAVRNAYRQLVVSVAREYAAARGLPFFRDLSIRRVEPVAKPGASEDRDKFQMGTWIAHKLCSEQDYRHMQRPNNRVKYYDMSEEVRRTTQQFAGKAFQED